MLARRDRVWTAAVVCTVASVLGGLFGYAIGYGLYEVAGKAVIEFYHLQEAFHSFQERFAEWGGWIIIAKGFTPHPLQAGDHRQRASPSLTSGSSPCRAS